MPPLPSAARLVHSLFAAFAASVVLATPVHGALILDTVAVRVYDNAGIPSAVRAIMLKNAAEILARTEFGVAWLVCPSRRIAPLPRACGRAPGTHEFVVRLTQSPRRAPNDARRALGFSLVDTLSGTGLSTVYVDRVDWLAQQAKVERGTVLGRAMAHEISHLLLGTNEHTARGLLREHWTAEELVRNRPEDWQLSDAQRTYARARLARAGVSRSATRSAKGGSGG
jgi:hypothetical protein